MLIKATGFCPNVMADADHVVNNLPPDLRYARA